MGTKIYTKTGDRGESSLLSGRRVSKSDERLEAYGTVDELNAQLGRVFSLAQKDSDLKELFSAISQIQNTLFVVGSHLACDDVQVAKKLPELDPKSIQFLETQIDLWTEKLPELKEFILPTGTLVAADLHLARTICRRAERRTVNLAESSAVDPLVITYLNRLSDFLFVAARFANEVKKHPESKWQK